MSGTNTGAGHTTLFKKGHQSLPCCALRKAIAVILDEQLVFIRVSEDRSGFFDEDGNVLFILALGDVHESGESVATLKDNLPAVSFLEHHCLETSQSMIPGYLSLWN